MSDSVSSDVQLFESEEFGSVRIIRDGDKFLFCSKDVCLALGYKDTVNAVKQHCRGVVKHHLIDSLGRRQEASFIPEGDLYRLVAHSRLPSALDFESWVFDEVLPTIRKTGSYTMRSRLPEDPTLLGLPDFNNPSESARAWADERDGRLKAEARVRELEPKALYFDHVLNSSTVYPVTLIAKEYGMSARAFNKLLAELGVQYWVGGKGKHGAWVLSAKYQDRGYTKLITSVTESGLTVAHTYWTEKGRLFLVTLLATSGYFPVADSVLSVEDASDNAEERLGRGFAACLRRIERRDGLESVHSPLRLESDAVGEGGLM